MKFRNITSIKNLVLAGAAIALAAPMAQAQQRVYNPANGRSTPTRSSIVANSLRASANDSAYINYILGYMNNYSPYVIGSGPVGGVYGYGAPYGYRTPGAVVLDANGRLFDTTPNPYNGEDLVNPLANQNQDNQAEQGGVLSAPTAQLNDQIMATRLSGNRVKLAWAGDPRPIARMQFSLLDSRRNEVRNTVVTGLPAQAIFTRPSNAVYYRVVITYGDGAVRTLISSL